MSTIKDLVKKIGRNHPLYAQILFTALAFFMMVILSYLFVSNIVHSALKRNAESLFTFAQAQIHTNLLEPRLNLKGLSRTVRNMILYGDDITELQNYFNDISDYLVVRGQKNSEYFGFFGYFETLPGGPVHIEGFKWERKDDFIPTERPWYQNAIKANGEIAETMSYHDIISGEIVLIYSRCIFDDEGRRIGVVGQRVRIDAMGKSVVNTAMDQGSYGMLISQDYIVIAHTNPDFIGMPVYDSVLPVSAHMDEILTGVDFSERPLKNWKGEDTVAFFKKLPNGWYLGHMTPKNEFYKSVTTMAFFLSALGIAFTVAMIIVLIQVDAARKKSDTESRHKSKFLANMSHEMRTPMNAIIGMTAIGKSAAEAERKDYCFSKIEDASKHLLGVINDILDISKIEANKFDLSPIEYNFENMLQRVVNVINFRIDEKKHKFSVHIDNAIPKTLVGDDQRLAQVITNLLVNAMKFTPEGGSIKLDASLLSETDGNCTIKITVSDTGIGIDLKHKERLFDSFEQAESSTTRKFGGSGLGLPISKNIVEMMGGELWVESELGKGSTFGFTIQVKCGSEKKNSSFPLNLNWDGAHIMVVDNDPDVLDYFKEISQILGFFCDTALTAEETFKLLENQTCYDICFLNWKIPGMNGIQLAHEIKFHSAADSVVLMIPAVEWKTIEKDAKIAGVDNYLAKPLFPSNIAIVINDCIDQRQQQNRKTRTNTDGIFQGRRILLAEDIEINREILTALLEPAMVKIDYAENGKEAVDMFAETPEKYDLILMDLQMPEMDGFEATRRIRAMEANARKQIPIIAMTANVFREDIEKCMEAGMNSHLGKPLDINAVFEKLRVYMPQEDDDKIAS